MGKGIQVHSFRGVIDRYGASANQASGRNGGRFATELGRMNRSVERGTAMPQESLSARVRAGAKDAPLVGNGAQRVEVRVMNREAALEAATLTQLEILALGNQAILTQGQVSSSNARALL